MTHQSPENLKISLKNIPREYGCYLWYGYKNLPENEPANKNNDKHTTDRQPKTEKEIVLYVGKASKLRDRVRQYLNSTDHKTRFLMARVTRVEYIVTGSETEALLLESNLIKEHNPPYNVRLKDDKRYPYLCLTLGEPYPRLIMTRRRTNRAHHYSGPFTDVKAARNTMALVHRIFPVRKRNLKLPQKRPLKPCLNYHIKRCWAPCTGKVDKDEYRNMVIEIKDFLEGNSEKVQNSLRQKMQTYSENMQFEKAARIRDLLADIEAVQNTQQVHGEDEGSDFDVIGVYRIKREKLEQELKIDSIHLDYIEGHDEDILAQLVLLQVRNGNLISKRTWSFTETIEIEDQPDSTRFFEGFFREYYLQVQDIPAKIFLSEPFKSAPHWQKLLSQKTGHKGKTVTIIADADVTTAKENENLPEKYTDMATGISNTALMQMALNNARLTMREQLLTEKLRNQRLGLKQIQQFLNLPRLPQTIECYDISNFQGMQAVGSGVMLKDGLPHKSGYRKYRIKTVEGANDPAMMYEVLSRRMQRFVSGQIKPPDLIIIDGGTTQLNAALEARNEAGVQVTIVGLAKKREEIYTESGDILQMDKNSPGMLLIRLARDEAHRFGVAYHRNLRMKKNLNSFLDEFKGIGKVKREKIMNLLRKTDLGSLTAAKLAEQIQEAGQIKKALGEEIAARAFELFTGDHSPE